MIYTNFVDLYSLMLQAKFQNHRSSGSEEEDLALIGPAVSEEKIFVM